MSTRFPPRPKAEFSLLTSANKCDFLKSRISRIRLHQKIELPFKYFHVFLIFAGEDAGFV